MLQLGRVTGNMQNLHWLVANIHKSLHVKWTNIVAFSNVSFFQAPLSALYSRVRQHIKHSTRTSLQMQDPPSSQLKLWLRNQTDGAHWVAQTQWQHLLLTYQSVWACKLLWGWQEGNWSVRAAAVDCINLSLTCVFSSLAHWLHSGTFFCEKIHQNMKAADLNTVHSSMIFAR